MKKLFIIFLMLIPLQLTANFEEDFKIISNNMRNGENSSITIKNLQNLNPNNSVDKFKRDYLLSLFYYSDMESEMQKNIDYLQKSETYLNQLSKNDYPSIIEFVLSLNDIYQEKLNFKDFVYEDLDNVIDLLLDQFNIRIDIFLILGNPLIGLEIKAELLKFKDNILCESELHQKEAYKLIDKIDKNILEGRIPIIDTKKNSSN